MLGIVSRAQRSTQYCAAEPGPLSLRRRPEVLARTHHQQPALSFVAGQPRRATAQSGPAILQGPLTRPPQDDGWINAQQYDNDPSEGSVRGVA
jgi:hypothetical protein